MSVAVIIALMVAAITLGYITVAQGKVINKYEKELIKKARKSK